MRVLREWSQFSELEPWGAPWEDFLSARSDYRYACSLTPQKELHKIKFDSFLLRPTGARSQLPKPNAKQQQLLGFVDFLKHRKQTRKG